MTPAGMSSGPILLGSGDLLLAALLLLLNAGLGVALRLGQGRRLLLAAVRAVAQLLLLGWVLERVFASRSPVPILFLLLLLGSIAGIEAVRRTRYRVRGLYSLSVAVMLVSSLAVTFYGTQLVLEIEPWYQPRYLVPILGMVLGNALNGVSLGLDTVLEGYRRDRDQVELLLAFGATRREASLPVVRRAMRTGMIPILNAMVAAGLISIPGMMTGQILAGEEPFSAALYQVFILFSIAGGVALGTSGTVLGATALVFDERDRLRWDRIVTLDQAP